MAVPHTERPELPMRVLHDSLSLADQLLHASRGHCPYQLDFE